jgi:hypothetical protein
MSTSKPKALEAIKTPVFPKALHHVRTRGEKTTATPKPEKRDNVFSKSRDTREDRGTRKMKTSHNDQTFHAR